MKSNRRQESRGPSWVGRAAMRAARSRWFVFLRRVFHYQNGATRSSLGSNPMNTGGWMAMELAWWTVQICVTLVALWASGDEKPVWPIRVWVVGYDFACFSSLLILYWRYRYYCVEKGGDPENEEEEGRGGIHVVKRCKATLEMVYAMWFVMGNVWVLNRRAQQAPKLQALSIFLVASNAAAYSFPFLLFLLLCVAVPLLRCALGFPLTISSSSSFPPASHHQLSRLTSWRFNHTAPLLSFHSLVEDCCICLENYQDRQEITQLPCSHIFHHTCVDHWLHIISCCPLCKQPLEP